jgi:hypothetical protein
MGRFFNTKVRPRLKRAARAVGIKERRARMPKNIPIDFDPQTVRILEAVNAFTMTSPERIQSLVNAVRYVVASGIDGCFVECGVWRGGSSMAVALTLKELGDESRHLYLYDTYEGMSAPTSEDVAVDGSAADGTFSDRQLSADSSEWCRSPIDEVKANLTSTGYPPDKLHFIKGKVEETIPKEMPAGAISILRLDTDWYESTRHELQHLYPALVARGVLIIDDYGHWAGAKKAVDDYLAEHQVNLLLNRVDYTARIAVKP